MLPKHILYQLLALAKTNRLVTTLIASNATLFLIVTVLFTHYIGSRHDTPSSANHAGIPLQENYKALLIPKDHLSLDDISWRVEFNSALNRSSNQKWVRSMSENEKEMLFIIVTQYFNYEIDSMLQSMPWEVVDTQMKKRRLLANLDQVLEQELQITYWGSQAPFGNEKR